MRQAQCRKPAPLNTKHLHHAYTLYITRVAAWCGLEGKMKIETVSDFRRAYRQGPYAWPGGYPLYFIASDGEAISFKSARENRRLILKAIAYADHNSGFRVMWMDVNWENPSLFCADTGERIPSAYAEDRA